MKPYKQIVIAALVMGAIGLAVVPANATHTSQYVPTNTKFYMRNSATTCPGTTFLSVTPGVAEPGCGYQGGAPFGELYHAGAPVGSTIRTYTTSDGVPVYLDALRSTTGNVHVVSTATTNRMAAGQVRVDVTVRATKQGGGQIVLGTSTSEQIVNPTNSAEMDFPFTLNVADTADRTQLTAISVDVDIRGFHVLSGYHRLNGQSWLDLATYRLEPIPD
jgi:hypothetical protein